MSPLKKYAEEVRKAGRYGDTMLAHITPREAGILKLLGGSGSINPKTGLQEFKKGDQYAEQFGNPEPTYDPRSSTLQFLDAPAPPISVSEIEALYRELLGRAPDPGGLAFYQQFDPATVRADIKKSPEYQLRVSVIEVFQTLIQASPDSEQELQYFRNKIIQQGSLTQDIIREIGQKNPYKYVEYQIKTSLDPTSSGGVWQSDAEFYPAFLAKSLVDQGITDLNDIDRKETTRWVQEYDYESGNTFTREEPVAVYTNKRTGKVIENFNLPTTYAGEGGTSAELFIENGKPIIKTSGFDTRDASIFPLVAIAVAIAAPYLLPEIIGTAASAATVAQTAAAVGATTAAEVAAIAAASSTGLTSFIATNFAISATAANVAATMVVNGAVGAAQAAVAGQDPVKGFLGAGIAPVIGNVVGSAISQTLGATVSPAVIAATQDAVKQLITTGQLDVENMLKAGASTVLQDTLKTNLGIAPAQAKLLATTIINEGKNLEGLTDPVKMITFIGNNQNIFKELGTQAETNAVKAASGETVTPVRVTTQADLGAFNAEDPVLVANRAAQAEGWTGTADKTMAISFYGANVTPEQWKNLSPYLATATPQGITFKDLSGERITDWVSDYYARQFSDAGIAQNAINVVDQEKINEINSALQAGQSAYLNDSLQALNRGTITKEEFRNDAAAAGVKSSVITQVLDIAQSAENKAKQVTTIVNELTKPDSQLSWTDAAQRLRTSGFSEREIGDLQATLADEFSQASAFRGRVNQVIGDYTAFKSNLSREGALERMVLAGASSEDANRILNSVDYDVAAQRNRIAIAEDAAQQLARGNKDFTEERVTQLLKEAGFPTKVQNDLIMYARGMQEGRNPTPGEVELAAVYAPRTDGFVAIGGGYLARFARAEDGTLGLTQVKDYSGKDVSNAFFDSATGRLVTTTQITSRVQNLQTPGAIATEQEALEKGYVYNLADYYRGENGRIYAVDRQTNNIFELLPSDDPKKSVDIEGGKLSTSFTTIGRVESIPANVTFYGRLVTNNPTTAKEGPSSQQWGTLAIVSERDNKSPNFNLQWQTNQDGSTTVRDVLTGDVVTRNAAGDIVRFDKSLYTKANEVFSSGIGTVQAGTGELGAAFASFLQTRGVDTSNVADAFKEMEAAGERMRPQYVNDQAKNWVQDIYRVAVKDSVTAEEIYDAVKTATAKYPIGFAAIVGKELSQEWPAVLTAGGSAVTAFLASLGTNILESAGNTARQKMEELKAQNPNLTPEELGKMAANNANVATLITGVTSLLPGGNTVVGRVLMSGPQEALEAGLIEYALTGDINKARAAAVLEGIVGKATVTGLELGSAAVDNMGDRTQAQITVTGKRLTGSDVSTVQRNPQDPNNSIVVVMQNGEEVVIVTTPNGDVSYVRNPTAETIARGMQYDDSRNLTIQKTFDNAIQDLNYSGANLTQYLPTITQQLALSYSPQEAVQTTLNSAANTGLNPASIMPAVLNSAFGVAGAQDNVLIDAAIGSMLGQNINTGTITRSLIDTGISPGVIVSSVANTTKDPASVAQSITIVQDSGLNIAPQTIASSLYQSGSDTINVVNTLLGQSGSSASETVNLAIAEAIKSGKSFETALAEVSQAVRSLGISGVDNSNALFQIASGASQAATSANVSPEALSSALAANNLPTVGVTPTGTTGGTTGPTDTTGGTTVPTGPTGGTTGTTGTTGPTGDTTGPTGPTGGTTGTTGGTMGTTGTSTGMTPTEIQQIINRTIAANPGISVAQVQTIVNNAIATLPASATPEQVTSAVAAATSSLSSSIAGLSTDTQAKFDALNSTQKQLALDLAQTTGNLSAAIDQVATQLGTQITTGLAGLSTDTQAKFDALNSTQKQLALDLAQTTGNLSAAIDQVATQLGTQITTGLAGLSVDTQSKFDALTNEQKQLALDLAQTTGNLSAAIDQVATSTATAIADVKTDISGVKTDISGVQTNVNNLKNEIGNRIDVLSKTTADADTLLRGSIDSVARDLGVTRDSLLATLGTTEANLKTEFTGKLEASQKAVLDAIALQSAAQEKAALEASKQSAEQARQQRIATGTAAALSGLSFSGYGGQAEFLKPGVVSSQTLKQKPVDLLAPLSQAAKETETEGAPPPAPVDTQENVNRMDSLGGNVPVYTYGAETDFQNIFGNNVLSPQEDYDPGLYGYAKGGRASNIQTMYAQGGREDHRHGKHVEGPGDGQSDDIPAWLADGEFVFPADVVSALGNGSTKAGTLKLYQMMHNIRKRARSTGHKDLPPAALKSPLDYLRRTQ